PGYFTAYRASFAADGVLFPALTAPSKLMYCVGPPMTADVVRNWLCGRFQWKSTRIRLSSRRESKVIVHLNRAALRAGNLVALRGLVIGVVPRHHLERGREFAALQATLEVLLIVRGFNQRATLRANLTRGFIGYTLDAAAGFASLGHL